jgi:hypothetical protein
MRRHFLVNASPLFTAGLVLVTWVDTHS